MASIDPVTPSIALVSESELPVEETVAAAATSPAISTTAPDLSSLESMVADVQTQLATEPDGSSTLGKIVGILAGVVSALVSLVANIWGKQSTAEANDAVSAQGDAPSAEALSSSSTSSAATSSVAASGATTASATSPATSSNTSTAATQSLSSTAGSVQQSHFDVTQNDQGAIVVRTIDGYIVRAEGKDYAWSVTGPDGMTTRIWGDPHVTESDGGVWDFKERGTFFFGKNKITLEVAPYGKDKTVSGSIHLYAGDERVTIKGLNTNKPVISAVSHDGKQHDDSLADGIAYSRAVNKTGEAWRTKSGSKTVTMGVK